MQPLRAMSGSKQEIKSSVSSPAMELATKNQASLQNISTLMQKLLQQQGMYRMRFLFY
jgi:hypothetical protein